VNWKLWLCIASGVLVIHIGIVMIWVNFQPRPKLRPRPDAFKARAQKVVDPNTGEHVTIREFTVSTRLAPVDDAGRTEDRGQKTD
jgi:ABC-type nickel/cobalt efflux system permease component RcnA